MLFWVGEETSCIPKIFLHESTLEKRKIQGRNALECRRSVIFRGRGTSVPFWNTSWPTSKSWFGVHKIDGGYKFFVGKYNLMLIFAPDEG